MLAPALSGFALGASLIIAIGAQNAFILRQGLIRSHVFILCFICALSDAVLIAAGVGGLGSLIAAAPFLISAVTLGGALFLAAYAFMAFRRAAHPGSMAAGKPEAMPLAAAVSACLIALTAILLMALDRLFGLDRLFVGTGKG